MRCTSCGSDNADTAVHCMNCGSRIAAPAGVAAPPAPQYQPAPVQAQTPYQPQPQAAPQYQAQQPQQQYAPGSYQYQQAPPQYAPQYQRPMKVERVPTIKNVHLGEILFLISSVLLIGAGFENLGWIGFGARIQFILLGLVAIVAGLLIMAMVVMPELIKGLGPMTDTIVLALSALFVLWGLAASFFGNVGADGGFLVAAGLFGLAGSALKMGMIK